jgi:ribonuclease VapC
MKRNAKKSCVLDASALMALINNEPGAEFIEEYIEHACISSINFTEVLSKMLEQDVPAEAAQAVLDNFNLEVIAFEQKQILGTSLLRTQTKQYGLSLADRICLDLGKLLKLPIITTDQIWKKLKNQDFNVIVVRTHSNSH